MQRAVQNTVRSGGVLVTPPSGGWGGPRCGTVPAAGKGQRGPQRASGRRFGWAAGAGKPMIRGQLQVEKDGPASCCPGQRGAGVLVRTVQRSDRRGHGTCVKSLVRGGSFGGPGDGDQVERLGRRLGAKVLCWHPQERRCSLQGRESGGGEGEGESRGGGWPNISRSNPASVLHDTVPQCCRWCARHHGRSTNLPLLFPRDGWPAKLQRERGGAYC